MEILQINENAVKEAHLLITDGKASCIVIKDGNIIRCVKGSGIAPVLSMYDEGLLDGAVLVDKVIGRATAMIAVHGGIRECHGITVSRAAYTFLCEHNVPTEYIELPDNIINRLGTDICPMEKAVMNITDTEEALSAVRQTLKRLSEAK